MIILIGDCQLLLMKIQFVIKRIPLVREIQTQQYGCCCYFAFCVSRDSSHTIDFHSTKNNEILFDFIWTNDILLNAHNTISRGFFNIAIRFRIDIITRRLKKKVLFDSKKTETSKRIIFQLDVNCLKCLKTRKFFGHGRSFSAEFG